MADIVFDTTPTEQAARLRRAWAEADRAGAAAQTQAARGDAVVRQFRCALALTTVGAQAEALAPALLAALVRRRLLPLPHALDLARHQPGRRERAQTLARLAAEAPPPMQGRLFEEAVATALGAGPSHDAHGLSADPDFAAHALAELAPHVPEEYRGALIRAALERGRDSRKGSYGRVELIGALLPATPDALLPTLAEVIPELENPFHQRLAVQALAPRLMRAQPHMLAAYARAIPDAGQRADALMDVLPHAPPRDRAGLAQEVLAAARAEPEPRWLVRSLARCAPHAPEPVRGELLALALAALPKRPSRGGAVLPAVTDTAAFARLAAGAKTDTSDGIIQGLPIDTVEHVLALVELGAASAGRAQERLCGEALATIGEIDSTYWRAQLLAPLAERGPDSLVPALQSAARNLPAPDRAHVLLALLPRAEAAHASALAAEIAALASEVASPSRRAEVLAALVARAPGAGPAVVAQALEAARAYPGCDIGAHYLAQLAPHLPPADQGAAWREALAAAVAIDEEWRLHPVTHVCALLPAALLPAALRAAASFSHARDRRVAVDAIAGRLPGHLLREAVRVCTARADTWERVHLRMALADALHEAGAHGAARRLEIGAADDSPAGGVEDPARHLDELLDALPHLADAAREQAIQEALALLGGLDGYAQMQAFARLAPLLTEPLLRRALAAVPALRVLAYEPDALTPIFAALVRHGLAGHARAIARDADDVGVYLALARQLPEAERPPILAAAHRRARGTAGAWRGAEALAMVAAALPPDSRPPVLAEAIAAARAAEEAWRSEALAVAAAALPEAERRPVLRDALRALPRAGQKGRALERLQPLLDQPLAAEALRIAEGFSEEGYLEAATILLGALPPEAAGPLALTLVDRVSAGAFQLQDSLRRLAEALAPRGAAELFPLWAEALRRLARGTDADLMRGLEPLLPLVAALGGAPALEGIAEALAEEAA